MFRVSGTGVSAHAFFMLRLHMGSSYYCEVVTIHSRLNLQTSCPTSFMGQESRPASLSSSGSASPSPYVLDLMGLQSAESIWDYLG